MTARIRKIASSILALSISSVIPALYPAAPASAQSLGASYYQSDYIPRTMDDLQQLAAPVALYPDALLAQVLVAASFPDDVISAARWIDAGHDPRDIDNQDWDLSVRGVAHYPQTLRYMADHPDWTNDLGDAFLNQQSDIMAAVQNLRAEANTAGNLVSDDRQQIYFDDNAIEIIPTNPEVIYVPQYDPQVVYIERYVTERRYPLIEFGSGISVGLWLHHDLDWHDHAIYEGSWGHDRPWWRRDDRNSNFNDRGGFDGRSHGYIDNRPGVYQSTNITNIRNTTIYNNRTDAHTNTTNVQSVRWHRDSSKPAPQPVARTHRAPDARPAAAVVNVPLPAAPRPSNRTSGSIAPRPASPVTPPANTSHSYHTRPAATPTVAPLPPAQPAAARIPAERTTGRPTVAPTTPARTMPAPTTPAQTDRADRTTRRTAAASTPQPSSPAPVAHAAAAPPVTSTPQPTRPARSAPTTPARAPAPPSAPPTHTARPSAPAARPVPAPSAPQASQSARAARPAPAAPAPKAGTPARAASSNSQVASNRGSTSTRTPAPTAAPQSGARAHH